MVDLTLTAAGRPDLEPVILNQASNEILEQYLDCSKAHEVLGWNARFTMEEALAETVAWYREHEAGR
jgi:CDP-glucose 4,6-dehydratase